MQLTIDSQYSSAVDRITANPITGSVRVQFVSGAKVYRFGKVSRRVIIAALLMPPLSVGEWVNRHCFN